MQYGVTPEELTREITEKRTGLQAEVERASTRPTPGLAQEMVSDVDTKQVVASPAENLAIFERAVKDLKIEDVNAALRHPYTGAGPLIVLVTPTPVEGGEATLKSVFDTAEAAPLSAPAANTAVAWPYTHFGAPGRVVEQRHIPDLGITLVRFANGVKLSFKQTAFRKDQILVSFDLPGGRLALPKDRETPSWGATALTLGGLKAISLEDTQRALTGTVFSVGAGIGDADFVLSGATRPADLDTQLQVLTAYLSQPGWRASGFERLQRALAPQIDNLDSTAGGVLAKHLETLLHPGDQRWDTPTKAEVLNARFADLKGEWETPMATGPVDVTIVGDLTLERAISAVASTVGSLPARSTDALLPAGAKAIRFPAPTPTPVILTHKGRADQAVAYEAWPTNDFYADPQAARTMNVAAQVLQLRLLDRLRILEGATYSPAASAAASDTFPGYGVVAANVETPPSKVASFYAATAAITADLRNTPISADELDRARKPRVEQIQKAQQTNEYWLGRMSSAAEDPKKLDVIRETVPGYARITPADVQAAARTYLRDDRAYKLVVEPADAGSPAAAK